MTRYWVRFYTDTLDAPPRPLTWCTGWHGDTAIVCAVVDAEDEDGALEAISDHYPDVFELDSCAWQSPDWLPPADRFPRAND